jgi:hypothetical protein
MAQQRIDRKLNFVVPVKRDSGTVYVHSMPLMRETFERYAVVLAQTYGMIHGKGLGVVTGPRIAHILLKQIAQAEHIWDGEEGVERGLMAEIRRLSNLVALTDKGWRAVSLEDALKRGALDADEASEVLGLITFFTVTSAVERKDQSVSILNFAAQMWGAQTSSLNCTEFADSLPTSTTDEISAPAAKP